MSSIIHQTNYSQLIPGINREDDKIQYTHGERCISHIGDGLPQPEKLIYDACNTQQRGRHTKLWMDNLYKISEKSIEDAFKAKNNKIQQWKDLLNKEVDSLAKEIEEVETCDSGVQRKRQYFTDLSKTSQTTSDFRQRIPGHVSDDEIHRYLKQELEIVHRADEDMKLCSTELKDCERRLKNARSALMSEVEAKVMTMNVNRRCQHTEPLLNLPYIPTNHPVDQIYHPSTEEDWAKNVNEKINSASTVRQDASKMRCRAESLMKYNLSSTADAWSRTSKAIIEAVQHDERTVHNIKNLLKMIGESISSTQQRIASLYDDMRTQDRGKTLQLWRLQTLTYRPGPDHIRDEPVKKLDEEVRNIESKNAFITENLNRSKALLQELNEEKQSRSLKLERLTKIVY